jgi:hypothetical protein
MTTLQIFVYMANGDHHYPFLVFSSKEQRDNFVRHLVSHPYNQHEDEGDHFVINNPQLLAPDAYEKHNYLWHVSTEDGEQEVRKHGCFHLAENMELLRTCCIDNNSGDKICGFREIVFP